MTSTVDDEQQGAISVITLYRPDARNAQDKQPTYDLDAAFTRFAADDDAKVMSNAVVTTDAQELEQSMG